MMSRSDGTTLTEIEHIHQSLEDISTTPIGSRLMRREYGTLLVNLIDQPISESLYLKVYSTLYSAYVRWEDRIEISHINVANVSNGQLVLDVAGIIKRSGSAINMPIPINWGAIS